MKKIDLLILFSLSLLILSINFIFQRHPGYMDSEYYFLGGKQLSEGKTSLNVIWNFLDDPSGFPHPMFSYWLPFPSILASVSLGIFGETFFASRIIFWVLAACLAPLTYYFSYVIRENRFVSIISGSLAIFSGYYFKYFTIPESIVPVMILGGVFILLSGKVLSGNYKNSLLFWLIGLLTGLLYLSRADGVIYLLLAVGIIIHVLKKSAYNLQKYYLLKGLLFVFIAFFLVIMGLFIYNKFNFGTFISPATSKAIWISTYDDTFAYPASKLTPQYFLEEGLPLRINQILEAIKLNVSSFIGVQLLIIGIPLFIIGLLMNSKNKIIRVAIILLFLITSVMTIIFPLAGGRGGFLHSASGVQIVIWYLIADGLQSFIKWGIQKRNWKMVRSQWMFGSAIVLFVVLITTIVYYKDVIGTGTTDIKWNSEYRKFNDIEIEVARFSPDKSQVIMINNPIGYYYSTGRTSVVIPNATSDNFEALWNTFDVKYLVIDQNLPILFSATHLDLINQNFQLIGKNGQNTKIYQRK